MAKVFVVMEKGFEYNDEINVSQEGGHPKSVFTSKARADAEVLRLTRERYRKMNGYGGPGAYGYGWGEVSSIDEADANARLVTAGIKLVLNEDDIYDLTLPKGLTNEQVDVVVSIFDQLSFYEVVEVDGQA